MLLLDISQRYKLKANHNLSWLKCFVVIVVGYKPKIQIESKSQLNQLKKTQALVVGYKPKIQIESKSQLSPMLFGVRVGCWI